MLSQMLFRLAVTNGPGGDTNFPEVQASSDVFKTGLQLFFIVLGAVTVLYILYAAIRVTLSQGDPQTISKERQAIVYAIVGLVVAISAELIVTFVLGRL